MTERSDITVDWGIFDRTSPRVVEVGSPSTQLVIQDLVDTLRSNTLPAGEPDLPNLDDDFILDAEGKVPVQPTLQTGIVSTLQNAKLRFEARGGPDFVLCSITQGDLVAFLEDNGSQTGGDSNTVLIDSAASFITFGIEANGEFSVENITDGSSAEVISVDSAIQLTTDGLTGGSDNLFQAGDVIQVSGFTTSPILPSAFTTVSYAASVAPSITALSTMQDNIDDIHGQVRRSIYIDTTAGVNGDGFQQSPYNNFTDAVDDAEANGITSLVILADATVDRQIRNFEFVGIGNPTLDINGQDINRSRFDDMRLDGIMVAANGITAFNCELLGGSSGYNGRFFTCGLDGAITLADAADVIAIDCWSSIGGLARPSITMGTGGSDVSIRSYRGGMDFGGAANVADAVTISIAQGKLTLLASCTAGNISVRGLAQFTDNSAGSTVDTTALFTQSIIGGASWDELTADHTTVGTFGEKVGQKLLTFAKWLGVRGGPGKS